MMIERTEGGGTHTQMSVSEALALVLLVFTHIQTRSYFTALEDVEV